MTVNRCFRVKVPYRDKFDGFTTHNDSGSPLRELVISQCLIYSQKSGNAASNII
jgi:hypothetical protein